VAGLVGKVDERMVAQAGVDVGTTDSDEHRPYEDFGCRRPGRRDDLEIDGVHRANADLLHLCGH